MRERVLGRLDLDIERDRMDGAMKVTRSSKADEGRINPTVRAETVGFRLSRSMSSKRKAQSIGRRDCGTTGLSDNRRIRGASAAKLFRSRQLPHNLKTNIEIWKNPVPVFWLLGYGLRECRTRGFEIWQNCPRKVCPPWAAFADCLLECELKSLLRRIRACYLPFSINSP